MPTKTALPQTTAPPPRQRPEEILAQTLSGPAHPSPSDGWSPRGRGMFLLAMAVAGVLLVIAGLLVTKSLAPGPGNGKPLETGPGDGVAGQLLQTSGAGQPPSTAAPGINIPLTPTPAAHSAQAPGPAAPAPAPAASASPSAPADNTTHATTPPTTTPPPHPTTTLPCGLLGQSVSQVLFPCPSASHATN
ncbi:MAG: hypothetical protein JO075_02810 [Acidimicrobiia bacterium]|nr:hypothetical protein [Acidimicrobiia bacterium]